MQLKKPSYERASSLKRLECSPLVDGWSPLYARRTVLINGWQGLWLFSHTPWQYFYVLSVFSLVVQCVLSPSWRLVRVRSSPPRHFRVAAVSAAGNCAVATLRARFGSRMRSTAARSLSAQAPYGGSPLHVRSRG